LIDSLLESRQKRDSSFEFPRRDPLSAWTIALQLLDAYEVMEDEPCNALICRNAR